MIKWLDDHPWLFSLILTVVIAGTGWGYIQYKDVQEDREDDRLVQCITDWAGEFTNRSDKLGTAARERDIAEDAFIRALANASSPEGRQIALDALTTYIDKSNNYETQRTNNPVPVSPELRCR